MDTLCSLYSTEVHRFPTPNFSSTLNEGWIFFSNSWRRDFCLCHHHEKIQWKTFIPGLSMPRWNIKKKDGDFSFLQSLFSDLCLFGDSFIQHRKLCILHQQHWQCICMEKQSHALEENMVQFCQSFGLSLFRVSIWVSQLWFTCGNEQNKAMCVSALFPANTAKIYKS